MSLKGADERRVLPSACGRTYNWSSAGAASDVPLTSGASPKAVGVGLSCSWSNPCCVEDAWKDQSVLFLLYDNNELK